MLGAVIQLRPQGNPRKSKNAAVATVATPKKTTPGHGGRE